MLVAKKRLVLLRKAEQMVGPAETVLTHGVQPLAAAVKDVIFAASNGASVEKWVSNKWGIPHAPLTLARFA